VLRPGLLPASGPVSLFHPPQCRSRFLGLCRYKYCLTNPFLETVPSGGAWESAASPREPGEPALVAAAPCTGRGETRHPEPLATQPTPPAPTAAGRWDGKGARTFCRRWEGCAKQSRPWRREEKCENLLLSALALQSVILIIGSSDLAVSATRLQPRNLLGRLCLCQRFHACGL